MLFCNIDHLDRRLLPYTRRAGYEFFLAASSLDLLFAHMEAGASGDERSQRDSGAEAGRQALLAAQHAEHAARTLGHAADMFRDLAGTVRSDYSHINDEVRRQSVFDDAARHIGVSPDSLDIQQTIRQLLEEKIEGVILFVADWIAKIGEDVRILGERILQSRTIEDIHYDAAHTILGNWRPLVLRGQFVSAVCYLSARVAV